MRIATISLLGILLFLANAACAESSSEADAITGTWINADGRVHVLIYKEADGTYSGKLSWLRDPVYPPGDPEAGTPKHDRKNPDPALRNRPLKGLKFLKGFRYAGQHVYKKGTIYDPESGKTYSSRMTLDGDKLYLRGYIGIALLGRTTVWTRYHAPQPKEPSGHVNKKTDSPDTAKQ